MCLSVSDFKKNYDFRVGLSNLILFDSLFEYFKVLKKMSKCVSVRKLLAAE